MHVYVHPSTYGVIFLGYPRGYYKVSIQTFIANYFQIKLVGKHIMRRNAYTEII